MNRRPRLDLRGAAASPEEAAAVIAAIEQFLRDTAPPPAPEPGRPPAWARAARLEAVGEPAAVAAAGWGDPVPWGRVERSGAPRG